MNIGDKIRTLRESKNMTQQELGEYVGKSDKTISTWETGFRPPMLHHDFLPEFSRIWAFLFCFDATIDATCIFT